MGAAASGVVSLELSAQNVRDKDLLSKSDPCAVVFVRVGPAVPGPGAARPAHRAGGWQEIGRTVRWGVFFGQGRHKSAGSQGGGSGVAYCRFLRLGGRGAQRREGKARSAAEVATVLVDCGRGAGVAGIGFAGLGRPATLCPT